MSLELIVKRDGRELTRVEAEEGLAIGRDPGCRVRLEDEMISRRHAQVISKNGQLWLNDLDSVNGIFSRGERTQCVPLNHEMRIEIPPFIIEVKDTTKSVSRNHEFLEPFEENPGTFSKLLEQPKSLNDLLYESEDPQTTGDLKLTHDPDKTEFEQQTEQPFNIKSFAFSKHTAGTADLDFQTEHSAPLPQNRHPSSNPAATMLVPFKMTARLHPINVSFGDNVELDLEQNQTTIGRAQDNAVQVEHPSVSAHHASIVKQTDEYIISDLGSSNGTRVNGDVVQETALRCHDVIELGDVRFEFLEGSATPQARSRNVIEIAEIEFQGNHTAKPMLANGLFGLSKQLTVGLAALCFILAAWPILSRLSSQQPQGSDLAGNSMVESLSTPGDLAAKEKERIIDHQISQAQLLIANEKYDEASIKVSLVLDSLDPQNLAAKTMKTELSQIQSVLKAKEEERKEQREVQERKVRELMQLAGRSFDQGRYQEAKSLFRELLAIRPGHSAAKEKLSEIDKKIAEAKNAAEKQANLQTQIKEHFTSGMVAYNANNFAEAAKNLRQVVAHPKSSFYSQARIALDDVEEKLVVETDEKLDEARRMYVNGRLVDAQQLVEDVLSATPNQKDALQLQQEILRDARDQAQKLYREGYTFERLVQDYNTAKERYNQVIDLLPDPKEPYHEKARKRLSQLD